jgi:hypothetical protein
MILLTSVAPNAPERGAAKCNANATFQSDDDAGEPFEIIAICETSEALVDCP